MTANVPHGAGLPPLPPRPGPPRAAGIPPLRPAPTPTPEATTTAPARVRDVPARSTGRPARESRRRTWLRATGGSAAGALALVGVLWATTDTPVGSPASPSSSAGVTDGVPAPPAVDPTAGAPTDEDIQPSDSLDDAFGLDDGGSTEPDQPTPPPSGAPGGFPRGSGGAPTCSPEAAPRWDAAVRAEARFAAMGTRAHVVVNGDAGLSTWPVGRSAGSRPALDAFPAERDQPPQRQSWDRAPCLP